MMYALLKETNTCRVCKKSFSNGKALGGHMRSHTHKLSLKCRQIESAAESATSSTIPPSLQASNNLGANFRPHQTVLMRSVHHTSEAVVGPKPDLNKEGGEQITGKRKFVVDVDKVNPTESQCCLIHDAEGAALCLVEMSKANNWPSNVPHPKSINRLVSTRKGKDIVEYIEIDSEVDDEESYYKYLDEDEDNEEEEVTSHTSYVGVLRERNAKDYNGEDTYLVAREDKCKKKYMCDLCGKVLDSYQALGGHRTSHRNKRLKMAKKNDQAVKPRNKQVVRRHFECQICGKAFESGQALGGHKKVHCLFLKPTNN